MSTNVFVQNYINKVFFSQNFTVLQLMSSCGYTYVDYDQLPWEGEENEEHGLIIQSGRKQGTIRRLKQFINCSTAE